MAAAAQEYVRIVLRGPFFAAAIRQEGGRYMSNRARDLVRALFIAMTIMPFLIPVIADSEDETQAVPVIGEITTVAGTGTIGFSGDGRRAREAAFSYPADVAIGSDGSLYISDLGNDRIRKVEAGTELVTTIAGGALKGYIGDDGPAEKAGLENPGNVVIDDDGNIYIADTGHNRVRVIDATTGTITTIAGGGSRPGDIENIKGTETALIIPRRLALDSNGNLFIAESGGHRVRRLGTDQLITTAAGKTLPNVQDTGGFKGDGRHALQARLRKPSGIAIDDEGNIYISDTGNHRIRRVNAFDGNITTIAGSKGGYQGDDGPALEANLRLPLDLAIDGDGNIFIADGGNHVIRRIDRRSGVITTVAGTGKIGYKGDGGPATEARLHYPTGIAIDSSGNLYIADTNNHVIRMVRGIATGAK